jgi:hypothetical protein
MSETKHTPGEWFTRKESCTGGTTIFSKGDGEWNVVIARDVPNDCAHLLVAAPRMLEALEDLLSECKKDANFADYYQRTRKAREAIAAAKGESK